MLSTGGSSVKLSAENVQVNRTRILDAASRLFREHGLDQVSVAEVMRAAGLTHGGFYNHFASKDALVAAALSHRSEEAQLSRGRDTAVHAYADAYLSAKHRDDRATSCFFSSLGTEASRLPRQARHELTASLQRQVDRFRPSSSGDGSDAQRRAALAAWSTMVGAMVLARLVDDPALSDEILAASRTSLPLVSPDNR